MYKEALHLIKKAGQPAAAPQTPLPPPKNKPPVKTSVPQPAQTTTTSTNTRGAASTSQTTPPAIRPPSLLEQFNTYADQNPFVRPLVYGGTSALLGGAFGGGKGALIGAMLGGAAGFGHDYLRNPQLYANLFSGTPSMLPQPASGNNQTAPLGRSPWSYGAPIAGVVGTAAAASYGPRLVNWLFNLFGRRGRGNSTALTLRGSRGGTRGTTRTSSAVMDKARQLKTNNTSTAPRSASPLVVDNVYYDYTTGPYLRQRGHLLPPADTALAVRR